jgi:gluconokinase
MTTRLVVMGVAGSGKTTVGERLADRLAADFVDADSAHPPANIEKMSAGIPLDDDDRRPWLQRLREELAASDMVVVTCSALKRSYRDVLRLAGGVEFVMLEIDRDAVNRRVRDRDGHFMKADMVDSQFADLERPTPDEHDVTTVDARRPVGTIVDELTERFGR